MGIRIKDTEKVKEIKYEQMLPIGNVDTDDARHVNIGDLSDFVESNIKMKGTFASSDELQGVYSAVGGLTTNIGFVDEKFTQQFITVGEQIAELETQTNKTEVWSFELEDGSIITKEIIVK